jgi:serine protease AprX
VGDFLYSDHYIQWIRKCSYKLDGTIRRRLLKTYRPSKHIPCFLHKWVNAIKHRIVRHDVIVEMDESISKTECQAARRLCSKVGKVKHNFLMIHATAIRVNSKGLEEIINHPRVKKIHADREVNALLDVASPTVEAQQLWPQGVTGKGVTVAVIDTGIHTHTDLEGRIVAFKDFVSERQSPYDDNGHGTHVAGDIASNGDASEERYRGPAPEASLVGVKVLNKVGSGSLSTVIAGVDWCIQNKERYDIRVINLSLGSQATTSCEDDPVCQIVEKAWREGIVVCAAAGNDGPESGSIGSPGIAPSIITVGAMDDKNTINRSDDTIASFSSRGPTIDGLVKPDVVAPGVDVISLRSPNSYLSKQIGGSGPYVSMSGTSMATPICAGIVALMLDKNPQLTPDEVKQILRQTAEDRGLEPNVQGQGYVHAKRAVDVTI